MTRPHNPLTTSAFALPDHRAAKADPELIAADEAHFRVLAEALHVAVADLTDRLDAARRTHANLGQEAMDRDAEVHRLSGRLRALRRFGLDLCLGRMVVAGEETPVYIGRFGLNDSAGRRLLVDWRSPAAEPFFAATHAQPMGLVSRRRYRWTKGQITDYWDEVFTPGAGKVHAALDDHSAFIVSLGESRSHRMRDVLSTIQADQDAIIRASSRGTLVVDGGPGTGKTVVALHRAAYLLYGDPRVGEHRGGVLFVGPHRPYLAYVADVLPSLGEEGVRTCTLRDLVPEGASLPAESDPEVARLKASAEMVAAIEPAVRLYRECPREGMWVTTDWLDVWLGPEDWAEAFDAAEPEAPHNEAREDVWEALLDVLVDKVLDKVADEELDVPVDQLRRALVHHDELLAAFDKAWTLIDPYDLVADLWSVPAYLRMCAPRLRPEEVRLLQRDQPQAWTISDLPLLDAARRRLGDPETALRRRRRAAVLDQAAEEMDDVIGHLLEHDDTEMQVMSMLRGEDLRQALVDEGAVEAPDPDVLAGPFAHVVVDEAQELTDAEWQMLLARCPSRSFTVVGDRAQARRGFPESWTARLERVGLDRIRLASLTVNYRTPEEVMTEAEPVIRAAVPGANVPRSVRTAGVPVVRGHVSELSGIVESWQAARPDGVGCVISRDRFELPPGLARDRLRALTPELAKGLEFDLVILVNPESFGDDVGGAVDRYVAMTRATHQLVLLR